MGWSQLVIGLMYVTTVSAGWSGVAVVGQCNIPGQVYEPDNNLYNITDNFGYDLTKKLPAAASCNCKLYISGGDNGSTLDTIIEADPRTGTSRVLTKMTVPRWAHTMNCVDKDTLIICGGNDDGFGLKSCELCHIANPICVAVTSAPVSPFLMYHAAVSRQGDLFLMGGNLNDTVLDYSILTKFWTTRAPMIEGRNKQPGAVLLNDGHILVCGGATFNGVTNKCESFDPDLNLWQKRHPMNQDRTYFNLVKVNGRVFAIGGDDGSTIESYDEQNDVWTMEPQQLIPRTEPYFSAVGGIDSECVA